MKLDETGSSFLGIWFDFWWYVLEILLLHSCIQKFLYSSEWVTRHHQDSVLIVRMVFLDPGGRGGYAGTKLDNVPGTPRSICQDFETDEEHNLDSVRTSPSAVRTEYTRPRQHTPRPQQTGQAHSSPSLVPTGKCRDNFPMIFITGTRIIMLCRFRRPAETLFYIKKPF